MTLMECYELNGIKFPLKVRWFYDMSQRDKYHDVTFIDLRSHSEEPDVQVFVPDNNSRYELYNDEGHNIGGYASEPNYELLDGRTTNKPEWF